MHVKAYENARDTENKIEKKQNRIYLKIPINNSFLFNIYALFNFVKLSVKFDMFLLWYSINFKRQITQHILETILSIRIPKEFLMNTKFSLSKIRLFRPAYYFWSRPTIPKTTVFDTNFKTFQKPVPKPKNTFQNSSHNQNPIFLLSYRFWNNSGIRNTERRNQSC